jgi:hypothetical protein
MNAKHVIARLLLAFVIFSVGYAVGKEVAQRRMAAAVPAPVAPAGESPAAGEGQETLSVLFLHATFRCTTCNRIEALAKDVVETEFADELASGRIAWRSANFQMEPDLARRYGIGTSSLLLSRSRDGQEVGFENLAEVWTRIGDEASYRQYVADRIRAQWADGGAP